MAVKITWKMEGFKQLRRDPALVRQIDDIAEDIADRAGEGFGWKSRADLDRYRAIVFTGSYQAMRINARNNTLLHALRGGGG